MMFVKTDCEECHQLRPTIEAVAANLKGKKNIAIINRDEDAAVTTRRFGIKSFPSYVLLVFTF